MKKLSKSCQNFVKNGQKFMKKLSKMYQNSKSKFKTSGEDDEEGDWWLHDQVRLRRTW
jgi:hypothetical protein